jgi:uncharacterized membrane protein
MQDKTQQEPPKDGKRQSAGLPPGFAGLAEPDNGQDFRLGARLRNYFLTGLVIVGPVTITLYTSWWFINVADAWVKPFLPEALKPDTYLPFPVPGIGLIFGIVALIMIGALAANLLGRTIISSGELFLGRMPIVRNIYRALKQFFESVVSAAGPGTAFQKVGLIEFPSEGIWSLVYVTGEATGEIKKAAPGGETDLVAVFLPTGIVPPTGFVSFVPRRDIIHLNMTVEDAAKIVISAGMIMPEVQKKLKSLAEAAKAGAGKPASKVS